MYARGKRKNVSFYKGVCMCNTCFFSFLFFAPFPYMKTTLTEKTFGAGSELWQLLVCFCSSTIETLSLYCEGGGEVGGRRDGSKVWESFNGKRSLPRNMMENQTYINFLEMLHFKHFPSTPRIHRIITSQGHKLVINSEVRKHSKE